MAEGKYFIYKYEWEDGSIYIGQSNNTQDRFGNTKKYKKCKLVYKKMIKHPIFSQEIIEDNLTEDNIDDREIYWISYYNSYWYDNPELGLNLTKGGQGSRGYKHTKDTKLKLSDYSKKLYNDPKFKERHLVAMSNQEIKKKISNARIGKFTASSNPNAKKVYQYTLDGKFIKLYDSCVEAGNDLVIPYKSIQRAACISNSQKTAGGFIWRYE